VKVLLRADASATQGTGHVMRCLTLAEALGMAGHHVLLATNDSGVPWLDELMRGRGLDVVRVGQHSLDLELVESLQPDWLVVDSYEIPPTAISACQRSTRVLAIIDGDDRCIGADLFLDHNIGAENLSWSACVRARLLAGSRYALVRHSIVAARREHPWRFLADPPHVLAVMGGSDPTGTIVPVTRALCSLLTPITATIVTSPIWRDDVESLINSRSGFQVVSPTRDLPELLSRADIAISAAGTSSWEICTLGIPSVLISVVENQRASLRELTNRGLAWGIDPADIGPAQLNGAIQKALNALLTKELVRHKMSQNCLDSFDGRGARRVVDAMAEFNEQTDTFLSSGLRD
jgi:UDP-2,4-diacetamido-2,4,6-trideoxy-beta-L-altropyranose hydrolase